MISVQRQKEKTSLPTDFVSVPVQVKLSSSNAPYLSYLTLTDIAN